MFPRLFHIGSFSLPTYGVLSAVGLLLGLMICVRLAKREGIDPDRAWDLGIWSIISAIVGAKLMLFVTDFQPHAELVRLALSRETLPALFHRDLANPHAGALLVLIQAGGVWYGGLLFGSLIAWLYMRRHKMPALKTFDAYTPGIAFGHILGRVGCFAAGCCYGRPTDKPWGVTFTDPLAQQNSGTPLGVPLHPTQLYEAFANTLIFLAVWWMFRRKKFDGQVLGAYFFLYGVARYFLEYFRDDPERGLVFGGAMTVTQLIAVCLVAAGGALWMRRPVAHRAEATA